MPPNWSWPATIFFVIWSIVGIVWLLQQFVGA